MGPAGESTNLGRFAGILSDHEVDFPSPAKIQTVLVSGVSLPNVVGIVLGDLPNCLQPPWHAQLLALL